MIIIESIKTFLATCPLLTDDVLNIDFLPPEATTFSVDVVPVQPIVKQYMSGSQRQFLFVLSTRSYYGAHIRQQLDNLGFFEDFSNWLDAQNSARNYPSMGESRVGQKLEVTTSGYVFAPDTDTARYQIQCRLSYYQKGER